LFGHLFPKCQRSDTIFTNKICGGGVITARSPIVFSCKCRNDSETCDECVWVEIPSLDGLNFFTINHYFPPDTKPEVTANYFHFLKNEMDTQHFNVFMGKDLNTPGFE
jgi:hypothetical protein